MAANVLIGAGLGLSAIGGFSARRRARRAALRAKGLARIQAEQVRASGQAAALEEQRQAELMHSRALALAAASGASASDVTATKILSGIEGEGRYRAELMLHQSESEARMVAATGMAQASALNDQASAYGIAALADIFSGAGSMYTRYGGGGPDKFSGSGTDTGNSYLDTHGGPPG